MNLRKENIEKIELIYREQYAVLLNFAKCALSNISLAEEAVQDAFRIACSKSDEFLTSPNPTGWIFNTLKYVIKKIRTQQARQSMLILKIIESTDRTIVSSDFTQSVEAVCADLLSEDDFKLFKMIDIEKYSIADAANKYGLIIDSCEKRI